MNAALRPLCRLGAVLAATVTLAGAADAAKPGAKPGETPKITDPFEPTRLKIDQLLKARINPEPLPATLPNPFTLPNVAPTTLADDGEVTVAAGQPTAVAAGHEPGSDADLLAQFAATLKISGMVERNGQRNFIINQLYYKEGDVILMDKKDPKSAVKIVHVAPGELILGYNDIVQTIRLKN
jgi:hypothetical protein